MFKWSERFDWTITQSRLWKAVHNETGDTLIARNKSELMSRINEWDRENQDKINSRESVLI